MSGQNFTFRSVRMRWIGKKGLEEKRNGTRRNAWKG